MAHGKGVDKPLLILTILCLLLVVSSGFLWYQNYLQKQELQMLRAELNDTRETLNGQLANANETIDTLRTTLNLTEEELTELQDDYEEERERNEEFEDQIRDITGTVRDLDKLSKTDEELLQKYSRVYFLSENYVPSDLDEIDERYILEGRDDQYFHGDALDFFEEMINAARRDDHELYVVSAYRSFDEQAEVKSGHTQVFGSGANTFSAEQGYSEHQLGTTVDLTTPEIGGATEAFADTEAYEWLLENAHEYGFTLSYPKDNSYYVFEPWHWRFVGEELATDLYEADAHLYDWEQREIDQYLLNIFD